MIARLRKALSSALGRRPSPESKSEQHRAPTEVGRAIDAARRRLKATIPPPED